MSEAMRKATIVGAGMAGLTAALRLAERGYKVTVYEQDTFVGGKFRAVRWDGKGGRHAFHEHSYHMFLNWYHNFWDIADQVGARARFKPLNAVKFLRKGEFPHMPELSRFGSPTAIADNLFAGVMPPADMFLYMYSIIDYLSTPMTHRHFRDLISVNGFAATRPYMTAEAAKMYDEYLAKTFSVASYRTSAETFQTFLEYGAVRPEPMYYMLQGDSYNAFLKPIEDVLLKDPNVEFKFGMRLEKVHLDESDQVVKLDFRNIKDTNPSTSMDSHVKEKVKGKRTTSVPVEGPVILALPPNGLKHVVRHELLNADPALGGAQELHSEPMASVHLHFNKRFQERLKTSGIMALPEVPVVLLDSKYKLSFTDCSRLWPDVDLPQLNVIASETRPLLNLHPPVEFTHDRESNSYSPPNLDTPSTMVEHILHELREFVYFDDSEIEVDLLEIDVNTGRELFINETGTWDDRPKTVSKIKNLFFAADVCQTPIDVVSLEGAVVSALQAVEAVRERYGGQPVEIKLPTRHPHYYYWPAKVMLAPYAAAAKVWSSMSGLASQLGVSR